MEALGQELEELEPGAACDGVELQTRECWALGSEAGLSSGGSLKMKQEQCALGRGDDPRPKMKPLFFLALPIREPALWGRTDWTHRAASGPRKDEGVKDVRKTVGGQCSACTSLSPVLHRYTFPAALGQGDKVSKVTTLCNTTSDRQSRQDNFWKSSVLPSWPARTCNEG